MSLSDEQYLLITTFRRDGTPVRTPIWIVLLDNGRLGCWTRSDSGKAKRLAHTSRVVLQPCDATGAVTAGSEPVEATAELVSGSGLDAIKARVNQKYNRTEPFPEEGRGVVITLDNGAMAKE